MDQVAVRFAPSPTGPLHIGGVRTALYNYLFARKHGGRFILRIEDTDQLRKVEGAEAYIQDGLAWLGITFDEGVKQGGPVSPYRQSDRGKAGIYRPFVDQLIQQGDAYYAFDSSEALTEMRERLKAAGSSVQQYNAATRGDMQNSLSLPADEVQRRIEAGESYVVRFNMPADQEVTFEDKVRGTVTFQTNQLDDKVLLKSDGLPTYHMANIVDDHTMGITHVIRGEEWVSSTPLHVLLYKALDWKAPIYAHLPLILNPNGKGKMSKRQGDKLGFSVFPIAWTDPQSGAETLGYREQGYLPEAMMNFLALLGWNPGTEEEVMDEARLTSLFSLERLNNSASKFDLDKLRWFNQTYLRAQAPSNFLEETKAAVQKAGFSLPADDYLTEVIRLMQERITFIHEIPEQAPFFFLAPATYNEKMARKQWKAQTPDLVTGLIDRLQGLESWTATSIHEAFQAYVAEAEVGAGKVMAPFRLALTGLPAGPGVFDMAALFGKQETIDRLQTALERLGSPV